VIARGLEHVTLTRKMLRQHVLRAMYELSDPQDKSDAAMSRPFSLAKLTRQRAWSSREARAALRAAMRRGLIERSTSPGSGPGLRSSPLPGGRGSAGTVSEHSEAYVLTETGRAAAWRVVRNHRLWELFLIQHADIAPSHVDRDADQVEHVLHPEMVRELEMLLAAEAPELAMPASPHRLDVEFAGAGVGQASSLPSRRDARPPHTTGGGGS
jgi:manganese/zinc/iron transport system permease protein